MNTAIAIEKKIAATKIYTLEEYLLKEERSVSKNEFYNGQIIPMPGAKYIHNQIASNMVRFLGNLTENLDNTYCVLNSDQKIYIAAANTALYPDAIVIYEKPEFWQGRTDLITNPMVIVEVLSRSTRRYDQKDKFALYQLLPSFKEYITIEQHKPHVESWFRQDEETWKINRSTELIQSIPIRSLGVELMLSDIYKRIEFDKKI